MCKNSLQILSNSWMSTTTQVKSSRMFVSSYPLNAAEIRVFLALVLCMGLVGQLDISEYWTTNPVTSTPFFASIMARDRFLLILTFFHLNDNQNYIPRGEPGFDALYKLGSVFQTILRRFQERYYPHQKVAIDEGMVPWRGNLAFKVYNKDKPTKYGIKAYMLCDSTNGYCSKIKLYTGKAGNPASSYGSTYDLVMEHMCGYFGRGHIVYCDNYYSSPQLFNDLWEMGIGATGTVRATRKGIPQAIKDAKLTIRGSTAVFHSGAMTVTKYLDAKPVLLLSTTATSEPVPTGKRDPRSGEALKRPSVVVEYNKSMGGVDRTDQMVAYAQIPIKTLKWWKKILFHVLNLAVLNSFIIYKETTTDTAPMLHRIFRRTLIAQLVSIHAGTVPHTSLGRPASKVLERLTGRHFLQKIVGQGKRTNLSRTCIVCNVAEREMLPAGEKRRRPGKETRYECKQCQVALCIEPCFELYHSKQEYILAFKRLRLQEE